MKLQLPVIQGLIDRRMLINFRLTPDVMARLLPPPFEPRLIHGCAMAGICLIRLREIRPRGWPLMLGIASENAAHRFAVTWKDGGNLREGVFIPRRDTSSYLNSLVDGRIFPGVHHRSAFEINEKDDHFSVSVKTENDSPLLSVETKLAKSLSTASIFNSLREASDFFASGSVGYSVTRHANEFDGLELHTTKWQMEPLEVSAWRSSYFEDERQFPKGSITFDSGFLMRNIPHEWRKQSNIKTNHE